MKNTLLPLLPLLFSSTTLAIDSTVSMRLVSQNGVGELAGEVGIKESKYGLIFYPNIHGLTPGIRGFHVHQNPSCKPKKKGGKIVPALAAGGHYDPNNTKQHGAPWGHGHLGDLPALYVDNKGNANYAVLAPRIKKLAEIKGRALMIHAGGDNHSDQPKKLGGGGSRVVCGIIE